MGGKRSEVLWSLSGSTFAIAGALGPTRELNPTDSVVWSMQIWIYHPRCDVWNVNRHYHRLLACASARAHDVPRCSQEPPEMSGATLQRAFLQFVFEIRGGGWKRERRGGRMLTIGFNNGCDGVRTLTALPASTHSTGSECFAFAAALSHGCQHVNVVGLR